jgi:hypothetical protein
MAAVQGGVDVLVHTTPTSGPWTETQLAMMQQQRVALIPTLKLYNYELRRMPFLQRLIYRVWGQFALGLVETGIGQLQVWQASGGDVLFGTDIGYMTDYDPSDEYALMADAGMSFRQILASLTTAPAERFGESERLGRVAEGFLADLVVLNRDPAESVEAFADVRFTLRDGEFVYPANK